MERAAVIDSYHNAFTSGYPGYLNDTVQGQFFMSRRHLVLVVFFAIGRTFAMKTGTVPGSGSYLGKIGNGIGKGSVAFTFDGIGPGVASV